MTRNHFEIHQRSQPDASGVFRAVYGAPAAVDYRLDSSGWSLLYDAKSSRGKSLPWSNLHPHQALYLDQCEAQGDQIVGLLLIHEADSQIGMAVLWADLRADWNQWHNHHLARQQAKLVGQQPAPIVRGHGSIKFSALAERAIYAGSTLPFTGRRFDFLEPVLAHLKILPAQRQQYRRQLVAEAATNHHHLRPYRGPLDLGAEE